MYCCKRNNFNSLLVSASLLNEILRIKISNIDTKLDIISMRMVLISM